MPAPVVAPFPRSHASLGSNPCCSAGSCVQGASSAQARCKLARLDMRMIAADVAQASQYRHPQPDGGKTWDMRSRGEGVEVGRESPEGSPRRGLGQGRSWGAPLCPRQGDSLVRLKLASQKPRRSHGKAAVGGSERGHGFAS